MLRRARPQEAGYVARLWTLPAHENFIDPPDAEQIATALAEGLLFAWDQDGAAAGFACLHRWHDGVYGLQAMVVERPGIGAALLQALLTEVFGSMGAHRLGLDVTADNARALRFFSAAGFQHEGVMRECWQRPAGDWVDCVFMAILARDWQP